MLAELNIDWINIVGSKKIDNGGMFGDLLQVARAHIEDGKQKGELTEQQAGNIYSQFMIQALAQVMQFELNRTKTLADISLVNEQIKEVQANTDLKTKQLEYVDLEYKLKEREIEIKEEELILKEKQINVEILKAQNEIELIKIQKDKELLDAQKIAKETELLSAQKEDVLVGIEIKKEQLELGRKELAIKEQETLSKIKLTETQIQKIECECNNANRLADQQEALYSEQAKGFRDNSKLKLLEQQLNAYAMVFENAEELQDDAIPDLLKAKFVTESFSDAYASVYGYKPDGNEDTH